MKKAARASLLLAFLSCAAPEPAHDVPHRIVSLAPNVTEIVFALGCGKRVVGTDDFSDANVPKVGGVQPNIERIVALKPDLVIANAAGLHPNTQRALAAVHVPLIVVRNERLGDIGASMQTIGAVRHVSSSEAQAAMQRALEAQRRQRTPSPRVMLAVWTD